LADVGPPTKEEKGNVCNTNNTKGGTVDYTLRRLARDNPELLDAIAVIVVMVGSATTKLPSWQLGLESMSKVQSWHLGRRKTTIVALSIMVAS